MDGIVYRRSCATCHGPIMVREAANGQRGVAICPKCSGRPELAEMISKLPTPQFIEHAATCSKCTFPRMICPEGIEFLAAYPGHWSNDEC